MDGSADEPFSTLAQRLTFRLERAYTNAHAHAHANPHIHARDVFVEFYDHVQNEWQTLICLNTTHIRFKFERNFSHV